MPLAPQGEIPSSRAQRVDPRDQGKALRGPAFAMLWRCWVGDYRLVCEIQDAAMVVLVVSIGHCSEVYR